MDSLSPAPPPSSLPLRIGVSACLLGQPVRYDGGHRHQPWLADLFGEAVEWVAVCPEMESGLGVPRPPVALRQAGGALRVLGVDQPDLDVTEALTSGSRALVARLGDICGFICKARSPSCGLDSAVITDAHGCETRGAGLFIRALRAAYPPLPIAEEEQLLDARRRARFVEQVLALHRLRRDRRAR